MTHTCHLSIMLSWLQKTHPRSKHLDECCYFIDCGRIRMPGRSKTIDLILKEVSICCQATIQFFSNHWMPTNKRYRLWKKLLRPVNHLAFGACNIGYHRSRSDCHRHVLQQ